jgi:hypothetical protein
LGLLEGYVLIMVLLLLNCTIFAPYDDDDDNGAEQQISHSSPLTFPCL